MEPQIQHQSPLKGKLYKLKCLLDSESRRFQEEISHYQVFATKTSAKPIQAPNGIKNNDSQNEIVPPNLKKTINDIATLKSVLSCPIFNRIVNVTSSMDELSNQLNLHPSIGPSDINIGANGELILAPPIQSNVTSIGNNLIQDNDVKIGINTDNPMERNQDYVDEVLNFHEQHKISLTKQQNNNVKRVQSTEATFKTSNNNIRSDQNKAKLRQAIDHNNIVDSTSTNISSVTSALYNNNNNPEKLITNGDVVNISAPSSNRPNNLNSSNTPFTSNGHKSHGTISQVTTHDTHPDQHVSTTRITNGNKSGPRSLTNQLSENQLVLEDGITNDMYTGYHDFIQADSNAIDRLAHHLKQTTDSDETSNLSSHHDQQHISNKENLSIRQSKVHDIVRNLQYLGDSCSPSTSIGSTVRLADECDSGASSYQSQSTKPGSTTSPPQQFSTAKLRDISSHKYDLNTGTSNKSELRIKQNIEPKLNNKPSNPYIDRIKVTLNKNSGEEMGIIYAGFKCEELNIAGLFIKSVVPGSQADLCGKIKELDQIYAVNGIELLGYSNPEAVEIIQNAGRSITFELARFSDEAKLGEHRASYQKLRESLMLATPENVNRNIASKRTPSSTLLEQHPEHKPASGGGGQSMRKDLLLDVAMNQATKKLASSKTNNNNKTTTQINNSNIQTSSTTPYSIQTKQQLNSPPKQRQQQPSLIPRKANQGAQQEGEVIETKQGPRNTIEIRSPQSHPQPLSSTTSSSTSPGSIETSATYVNKLPLQHHQFQDVEQFDVLPIVKSDSIMARLKNESSQDDGLPEWDEECRVIDLYKDPNEGLGFVIKEYTNPKDSSQSIIMVYSITPDGVADRDGRLSIGDRLIFVDDVSLLGANLSDSVRALRKTNGQVKLGVFKIKH